MFCFYIRILIVTRVEELNPEEKSLNANANKKTPVAAAANDADADLESRLEALKRQ
jgi:hypothetical protein